MPRQPDPAAPGRGPSTTTRPASPADNPAPGAHANDPAPGTREPGTQPGAPAPEVKPLNPPDNATHHPGGTLHRPDNATHTTGSAPAFHPAEPPALDLDDRDLSEGEFAERLLATIPENERELEGADLFAEACLLYGVNPDPDVQPAEILPGDGGRRWRFYHEDRTVTPPEPPRVKFVTAGGVKIAHPMDLDFEGILRTWFKSMRRDPKTNELVALPLPENLTLPREACSGIPSSTAHVFQGGYLRSKLMEKARAGVARAGQSRK